ncbi:MAG TPA: ATPase, partial [Synergistaceae bacterium]|nr:ATPase [Synergistaceae bacterium]
IGCPVIASLSGADMVLIVAEPSLSGISDMERIIKTARIFGVIIAVCVNKSDTNPDNTDRIKDFCELEEIPYNGSIPFDPMAVKAVNKGMSIADIDCPSGTAVKEVFNRTMRLLFSDGRPSQR